MKHRIRRSTLKLLQDYVDARASYDFEATMIGEEYVHRLTKEAKAVETTKDALLRRLAQMQHHELQYYRLRSHQGGKR